jgi:hypothetical protein
VSSLLCEPLRPLRLNGPHINRAEAAFVFFQGP